MKMMPPQRYLDVSDAPLAISSSILIPRCAPRKTIAPCMKLVLVKPPDESDPIEDNILDVVYNHSVITWSWYQ